MAYETDLMNLMNRMKSLEDMVRFLSRLESGGSWTPLVGVTYASSTRMYISNADLIFSKGDQVRYKQGGSYKFGSVFGVASTYIDVTGGSNFSVANAAITDFAFSKSGGVGHPGWYNWTPSFTFLSSVPPSNYDSSASYAVFMVFNSAVYINAYLRWVTAGTAVTRVSLSIPVLSSVSIDAQSMNGAATNGITPNPSWTYVALGSNRIDINCNSAAVNRAQLNGFYII